MQEGLEQLPWKKKTRKCCCLVFLVVFFVLFFFSTREQGFCPLSPRARTDFSL